VCFDPSTEIFSIAEQWQTFRGSYSSGVDGIQSPGISTRRKIKRRSPLGGWASMKFFRSLTYVLSRRRGPLLTFSLQNELTTSSDAAIPAVRHDVANTHTLASGVQNDVADTPVIVSDSYRNTPTSPENVCSKNRMVSTVCILPPSPNNHLTPPRLTPGQRSRLKMRPVSNVCIQAPGDSPPSLPRSTYGMVSDIRNDVMKSRAILSDIRRAIMQNQEEGGSKHLSVSDDPAR